MKIIKFIVVITFFIVIFSPTLHAIDDQAVLQVKLREALNLEQRGNSIEAEKLYKQLLENFPHNRQVVNRLINLYLRTNKLDSLEKFLEEEKDFITNTNYEITRIELLIKKISLMKPRTLQKLCLKIRMSIYRLSSL